MRWSGIVALLLLPLAPVVAKSPLLPVTNLTANVVRAGCGERLYFAPSTLTAREGRFLYAAGENGTSLLVSPSWVAARKPGTKDWSLVDAPALLLFPELFGDAVLDEHFTFDGKSYVPKSEDHRKLVASVRIRTDPAGRPREVTLLFAGGGREDRSYERWAAASAAVPIPPPDATAVAWPPEKAWGSRVETVLDALAEKVRGLTSISGEFVREKRTQLLLKPAVAAGRFLFVPGRLLWIDEEPRKSRVLITRTKMEIHDPANGRLERFSFGDSKLGEYVFLGFGDSTTKAFRTFRPLAFEESEGEVRFRCQPVGGPLRGHIRQLEIVIDARTGLMKEMSYRDPSGDSVTTKVSEVRTDRKLTAKDVTIQVPKGTRVVDNEGDLPWR